MVWYCDKVEWDPDSMRSKLSLFFTLPSPLGNKRLNFLSVQLPPAWMKGSDKTDQDFKVGISNEDRRMNTDSEQSGNSPAGTGEARLLFFCIFFIVIKWTTETSFISSIKYCYLQYLCCLLCNPTTWVNQINTLKARTQWNITRSKDQFSLTTWTQASANSEDINNKSISTNIGTQRTYILPRYELTQHKKKQGQPKPCLFCCAQLVLC